MDILEKIIAHKRKEVAERKSLYPVKLLEKSIYFSSPCVSLRKYLLRSDKVGVIAEFKRRSPSKGVINRYAPVERTSIGYMQAGASALSVLTDSEFFGGKSEDLSTARKFNYCPILRKDFTIDEYQVIEARSIGADAVLLLANVLSAKEIKAFSKLAHALGMETLLEVREEQELASFCDDIDAVGVNNRDLRTFKTDVKRSHQLVKKIPADVVRVSESGIDSPQTIIELKKAGFNGFLIGESFMKHSRPEKACADLIASVQLK
jgi:indole-3-glycerol phosphate synthase